MIYAGIDAGSRAIKIVLLENGPLAVLRCASAEQGPQPARQCQELFDRVLGEQGLARGDIARVVATGYARSGVTTADTTITEITCHAVGVHHVLPEARTVVEIGGQDSKLLRLADGGHVRDFAMNDRCAAGTGRFLELVASRLGCGLADLGALAERSTQPAAISSMCAVFAETEIIGLLSTGCSPDDIVAGAQGAIASRIAAMAGPSVTPPVAFTGGVAMVAGMGRALAAALGHPVVVPPDPQFTGALGAALMAARQRNDQ
jgi:(R)-2-hydroxyacyl-CoA dehydratese activating ATPase